MPIGVDEWVAQHGDRRDQGTGWRRAVSWLDDRVGWWPRLGAALLVGLIFGQLSLNVNIETVAVNSLIYAILALGLNIAVGWAGLLDLGYVAFFGFGAYGYAIFSSHALGTGGVGGAPLPSIESFPIVLIAAGVLGALIGLMSLRVSGDYLAIVTLFVGQAFMELVNNVDTGTLGGVNGLYGLDPIHGFGGQITTPTGYYDFALIAAVVLMGLLHMLDGSRTGRAWRAVREDELAAEAMTIPTGKLKVMAISFGAVVGALAGAIFAAQQDNVFPTNFTPNILILIYACLVLGGAGSIAGAVLGGIVVTVGEQMVSSPTDAGYLFYGLILIALVVRVRPWRMLGAVLAGVAALGFALHAIVGAISSSAVAGSPGSAGWIGSAVHDWVIVPSTPAGYGNVLYIVLICMVFAVVRVQPRHRLLALVPTLYVAACCWESRLVVNPSITAQILVGAILIAMMAARPQGLLGTMRVEVV
ncbi:MAG: branched-chain amino acid ABC transporter permease [Solirubrobacteraceae bacterium]|jgi:branched-chain amino acid transport system permease protein